MRDARLQLLGALLLMACGGAEDAPREDAVEVSSGSGSASETCYVTEVNEQTGCWDSAASACTAGGCDPADCRCTEATANNDCSCSESTESCYAIEAGGEQGCWPSAEEACVAAACGEMPCTCTEASANNTCHCAGP